MVTRFFAWFNREPDTAGPVLVLIVAALTAIGMPPVLYYLSKWWSWWIP